MRLIGRPTVGVPRGGGAGGRVKPIFASGINVVSLGDSLFEHNHRYTASTELSSQSAGPITWAKVLCRNFKYSVKFDGTDVYGRNFTGLNLGDTADTAANIAAGPRVTEAIAFAKGGIVIMNPGTNDIEAGRTTQQVLTDRATIYNALLAGGCKVILLTVLPRNDWNDAKYDIRNAVNAATRALSIPGLYVVDANPFVEDFTSRGGLGGFWKPGYNVSDVDLVHMGTRAGFYVGRVIASKIMQLVGRGDIFSDENNLITNAGFTGTGGARNPSTAGLIAGTVPDSWRVSRSSGDNNPAVDLSTVNGKFTMTFKPGGTAVFENYVFQQFISASANIVRPGAIQDGNWVILRFDLDVQNWGNQWSGFEPQLTALDSLSAIVWRSFGCKFMDRTNRLYPDAALSGTFATEPFIVTSAMTQFQMQLNMYPRMNGAPVPGVITVSRPWFGVVPDPATLWS